MAKQPRPKKAAPADEPELLGPDEAGALRIGATDQGMVRLIITMRSGAADLDFDPDEAEDIAHELLAAAERARAAR